MAETMFIKIGNIKGEVTDSAHRDEIQVTSWSHSFNQSTNPTKLASGTGTVGHAQHGEFSFTKYSDLSTDDILKACWAGVSFKKAQFTAYRPAGISKGPKFLEIHFKDLIISNFSIGGNGEIPTETVELRYGAVEYKYFLTADAEAETAKHDLVQEVVS